MSVEIKMNSSPPVGPSNGPVIHPAPAEPSNQPNVDKKCKLHGRLISAAVAGAVIYTIGVLAAGVLFADPLTEVFASDKATSSNSNSVNNSSRTNVSSSSGMMMVSSTGIDISSSSSGVNNISSSFSDGSSTASSSSSTNYPSSTQSLTGSAFSSTATGMISSSTGTQSTNATRQVVGALARIYSDGYDVGLLTITRIRECWEGLACNSVSDAMVYSPTVFFPQEKIQIWSPWHDWLTVKECPPTGDSRVEIINRPDLGNLEWPKFGYSYAREFNSATYFLDDTVGSIRESTLPLLDGQSIAMLKFIDESPFAKACGVLKVLYERET